MSCNMRGVLPRDQAEPACKARWLCNPAMHVTCQCCESQGKLGSNGIVLRGMLLRQVNTGRQGAPATYTSIGPDVVHFNACCMARTQDQPQSESDIPRASSSHNHAGAFGRCQMHLHAASLYCAWQGFVRAQGWCCIARGCIQSYGSSNKAQLCRKHPAGHRPGAAAL